MLLIRRFYMNYGNVKQMQITPEVQKQMDISRKVLKLSDNLKGMNTRQIMQI